MSPYDRTRLEHISEALKLALQFAQGRKRSDLETDTMLVFAPIRAIEIVGEAASRMSPEGRAELSDLPCPLMIGMRNRLAHAYFDVDLDILWDTVTRAVPPVARRVDELLED